jgi:hypothetical protein
MTSPDPATVPEATDRFADAEPARPWVAAVAIGLAVSVIGHALLIGIGFVRLDGFWGGKPTEQTIPVLLVPDPKKANDASGKTSPATPPKPDAGVQPKPPADQPAPAELSPPVSGQAAAPMPPSAVAPPVTAPPPAATVAPGEAGADTKMTAAEFDGLRAEVERCWKLPKGWTDPKQVSVTVDFRMKPDGSVVGRPGVIEFPASVYGKEATESALRAVPQCGPYHLPAAKYDAWREVQLRLSPAG